MNNGNGTTATTNSQTPNAVDNLEKCNQQQTTQHDKPRSSSLEYIHDSAADVSDTCNESDRNGNFIQQVFF